MQKANNQATSTVVAKINNVEILVLNDPDQPVPIKPICEILGVDIKSQRDKISEDEILSSVRVLSTATGSDGKKYEMVCLPFEFIFGWLFTINPKNVAPEAKETVIKYKRICYHALYEHFVGARKFLELKEEAYKKQMGIVKNARKNFRDTKEVLKKAEDDLFELSQVTYESFVSRGTQLTIFDVLNEKESEVSNA